MVCASETNIMLRKARAPSCVMPRSPLQARARNATRRPVPVGKATGIGPVGLQNATAVYRDECFHGSASRITSGRSVRTKVRHAVDARYADRAHLGPDRA